MGKTQGNKIDQFPRGNRLFPYGTESFPWQKHSCVQGAFAGSVPATGPLTGAEVDLWVRWGWVAAWFGHHPWRGLKDSEIS